MPMTTVDDTVAMPLEAPTLADVAFAHRWLSIIREEHPDIPEVVLACFFEYEAVPSVADIQEALACDQAHAANWHRVLSVRLVSPGEYVAPFAAQDALTACQQAWQRFQDDVRATTQRLQELQRQIEASKAYAHSLTDAEEQAEVQSKVEALDEERVATLRHQSDLPGVGRLLEHEMATAKAALEAAEAALKAAQVESLQQAEEQWQQELLTLLEPAQMLLSQGGWLDQAWQKLGVAPGREHGKERLREAALARLRREEASWQRLTPASGVGTAAQVP
jgi:tRNA nucleotidyltransferase/poly(A) polymerase